MTDMLVTGTPNADAALHDLRAALGHEAVHTDGDLMAEMIDPYEPVSWGGQRNLAVVQPASVEEVQAVVRIANQHGVPLWVGSQGRNNGYGGSGSVVSGSIVVNLRRMNQVLEVNEDLGYVVVEPGVSYFDLYDHIKRVGAKLFIDVPDLGWGSVIGNTADHGWGYTEYGDHAQALCGMEVVLPDGEVMRTGMGGLEKPSAWHVYKRGYGPSTESLFLQSNFGIITRMGVWCMPEPEVYMNGMIRVEADEDLPGLIDAIRPLMLDGTIANFPSCFNAAAVLTMLGSRESFWSGEGPIPHDVVQKVREATGLGAWMMRFALYGRDAQVDESYAHITSSLSGLPGISVTAEKHDGHDFDPSELDQAGRVQAGVPDLEMLQSVKFAGENGGHVGFSSVIPLSGRDVTRIRDLVRAGAEGAGIDYTSTFLIQPRCAVHVFLAVYNRDDEVATNNAYDLVRTMIPRATAAGYGEYRAHVSMMDMVADQYAAGDHAQHRFFQAIKDAVDPNGILMPGRAGIWPARLRGRDVPAPWKPNDAAGTSPEASRRHL